MRVEKILVVLLLTMSVASVIFASVPDQPYMQAARTELQQARASLERAEHNKDGHRLAAIGYVNEAIAEVNRGIAFGRRHYNHAEIVSVDQPNMRAALDHLRNAKRDLELASTDKGGHRANAIGLVNKAIDEVNRGIAAGN